MTPKIRTLHRQADQLASDCFAELRDLCDWLEGVSYGAPVSLPPNETTLEDRLRHLRQVCARLHAVLVEEQRP